MQDTTPLWCVLKYIQWHIRYHDQCGDKISDMRLLMIQVMWKVMWQVVWNKWCDDLCYKCCDKWWDKWCNKWYDKFCTSCVISDVIIDLISDFTIGRAECVRCPWLLAQTKVATIFDNFSSCSYQHTNLIIVTPIPQNPIRDCRRILNFCMGS